MRGGWEGQRLPPSVGLNSFFFFLNEQYPLGNTAKELEKSWLVTIGIFLPPGSVIWLFILVDFH